MNSALADTAGFVFLPYAGIAIASGSRAAFEAHAQHVLLSPSHSRDRCYGWQWTRDFESSSECRCFHFPSFG